MPHRSSDPALHTLTGSDLEKADVALAEKAASRRHHPAVRLAGTLSEIADQPQLAVLCCATIVGGLVRSDLRLARTGVRMLAAHALSTWMKSSVKHSVKRTRPFVLPEEGRYEMKPGKAEESKEGSFPSGHTSGAVAVASVVAGEYPRLALTAFGVAAAIALVQVPRGKHYPADLLAGMLIGLAAGGVVHFGFDMTERAFANHGD